MSRYLVIDIGCIECRDETSILGVFNSLRDAQVKYPDAVLAKSPTVVEYGESIVIFKLPEPDKLTDLGGK